MSVFCSWWFLTYRKLLLSWKSRKDIVWGELILSRIPIHYNRVPSQGSWAGGPQRHSLLQGACCAELKFIPFWALWNCFFSKRPQMPITLTTVGGTPRHITMKGPMTNYITTIYIIFVCLWFISYALQVMEIVLLFTVTSSLAAKSYWWSIFK